MITHADLPDELNLATWFVDRNVEEGRGDRTALIGSDGGTTYSELARLVNRCGNLLLELGVRAQDRVLLVLGDSVDFVALWYGAQKIGAVTAEAYTFLQPKDYAYYLEYTDAKGRRGRRRPRRPRSARSRASGTYSSWTRSSMRGSRRSIGRARGRADDEGRHRALEVHDRQHRPAEGRRPSRPQPGAEQRLVRAGRARDSRRRRRAAGAEALLRLRARPDRALPVRRRRRGDRLPGALDPGADLRADRRAPSDDPRQRADDDGPDDRLRQTWPGQAPDMSCLRMCTSAGEALPRELHDRWLDTFGVEVLDGIGSSELYHIYISNRPGRARPG